MGSKPTNREEALEFVWQQPDTTLTFSHKQQLAAFFVKGTDQTAQLSFRGPAEGWVGTLKQLLESAGTSPV